MPDFVLSAKITARDTVKTTFDKAEKAVDKFGKTTRKSFDKASRSQKNFTTDFLRGLDRIERRSIGAGGIIRGTLGADIIRRGFQEATRQVGSFITEAGKVERATTEFQVLLRSMEKGAKLTETLRELSAVTPFQFENLARTTKLLLAMRAATEEDLIPTLRMLGDAAGGSSVKLERIAFAFGEVKANSKASFQEIRQFTNAGVPMLATLADMWGKNMQQARKMVRMGKATGPAVAKAFKIMTSEGGIFYRGMERTSKDFEGRMSTLTDNIKIAKATIGEQLLPTVKEYVIATTDIARSSSKWVTANKDLINTEFIFWLDTSKRILTDLKPVAEGFLDIIKDYPGQLKGAIPIIERFAKILKTLSKGFVANRVILALMTGQTGLLIKDWVKLSGGINEATKLIGETGTKVFFKTFQRLTFLDRQYAKLGFTGIAKIGEFIGADKTVTKEFSSLAKVMDDLDLKLRKAAGETIKSKIKIAKGFAEINKLKFTGIEPVQIEKKIKEPGLIEFKKLGIEPGTFDFSKISGFSKTEQIQSSAQIDRLLSLQKTAPDFTPILFDKFIRFEKSKTGNAEERIRALPKEIHSLDVLLDKFVNLKKFTPIPDETGQPQSRDTAEMPFPLPPETVESFNFETIRHLVQLDVNAPEGSKVSVRQTGTPGGGAPPVEINTLGAN